MVENNEENREKLAKLVVDEMDIFDLLNSMRRDLVEKYEESEVKFKSDLQWHVDEDGNLYE